MVVGVVLAVELICGGGRFDWKCGRLGCCVVEAWLW